MLLGLLAVTSVPAIAQDLDVGKQAALRGDFAAALAELRPLAEQGVAEAQYGLGTLYRDGHGVARDNGQAAAWFSRAAEGGSWWAAFDLGMLYWGQIQASKSGGNALNQAPDDTLVRVHMWLGIAAVRENGGCVTAAAPLRDVVAQSMTAEQVSAAEARTLTWLADHKITDINLASAGKPGC